MKQSYRLCSLVLLLIGLVLLSGCAQRFSSDQMRFVSVNPSQHLEQEIMLERISQALSTNKLNREERATLHFERGVIYDSLGLWNLARRDFEKALSAHNRFVAAYNYLGLYALLEQDYDRSIKIFNLLLELDPQYSYAFLNRGLAFYYAQRYHLAEQDFLQFYQQNQSDPYALLWLYWNDLQQHSTSAKSLLEQRAKTVDSSQWGNVLVQYFLGKLSATELFQQMSQFAHLDSVKYAEVLTETYFYLAKQQLNLRQPEQAEILFKWALANQIYNFVEYRFAMFELIKLSQSNK